MHLSVQNRISAEASRNAVVILMFIFYLKVKRCCFLNIIVVARSLQMRKVGGFIPGRVKSNTSN